MKTNTQQKLLDIIKNNNSARPSDLSEKLRISPQAVHRHLKKLVDSGFIERAGNPPFTRYAIIDVPDFSRGFQWFSTGHEKNSQQQICETRDVFSARLSHLVPLQKQGLSQQDLPLVVSVAGEIGNNSFDHNLGQWHDAPGCWFEFQMTKKWLWILIADRGQGIFKSLSSVVPNLTSDQEAINKAFLENISGRSSETRGNGLKYVVQVIQDGRQRGVACVSGIGKISFGDHGKNCAEILSKIPSNNFGTITLMSWGIS